MLTYDRQFISHPSLNMVPGKNHWLIVNLDQTTLPFYQALTVCSSCFHHLVHINLQWLPFLESLLTFQNSVQSSFSLTFIFSTQIHWRPVSALFLERECSEQDKNNLTHLIHSFIISSTNIHWASPICPALLTQACISPLSSVCDYGSIAQYTASYHSLVYISLVFLAK